MININGTLIDQYCQEKYNISLKQKIALHIKEYLDKDLKLPFSRLHMATYEICEHINEIVYLAPLGIDENKFFNMVKVCVLNEIKNNWYKEPPKKEDKLVADIERAMSRDNYYDED
jgi:hypothetical protein